MNPWTTAREAIDDLPTLESGERSNVPDHDAPTHTDDVQQRIANTDYGELLYESYQKDIKLDPEKPSRTIKGSNLYPAHYSENRGLTVREKARLQSFPDTYEFVGTVSSTRKQVGNAVPPRLSERIGVTLFCL